MIEAHNNIASSPVLSASRHGAFEKGYIGLREKEKRIYTDVQVALLPLIHTAHVHYKEWKVRKRSANRLFKYLKNKNKPLSILEVGCGNGWLIAKMAAIPLSEGTGIDINRTELEQAKRVFKKKDHLHFLETDLRQGNFNGKKFDVVIFAASIQYFDSLEDIIPMALSLLKEDGEIHILDSYFYSLSEIDEARKRTQVYYRSLGYEEMAAHYFHHSIDSLKHFNHNFLFKPSGLKNKIFKNADPFPWISIKHK